ncbi:MAG: hypothetical protein AVDCRST_MAG93-8114, partial [uncultured Chloroflexia bacterium]
CYSRSSGRGRRRPTTGGGTGRMNLVVMRLKSNGHPHSLKPIVGVAT